MIAARLFTALLMMPATLAMTVPAQQPAGADPEHAGRAFVQLLADGHYAAAGAVMDTTMQRAMPVERLRTTWESVVAQVGAFGGIQRTAVTRTGAYRKVTVTCDFAQAALDVLVVYDTGDRVAGLFIMPTPTAWTPAPYVTPEAFRSAEATVGQGALALPATITIPAGHGPFPAVVLVHGSGPNDRDESVGGVKVFRDLAEGLASRGIVVLRYEKRTRAHPMSFTGRFTVDAEAVDDAVAAAELLRGRPEVDPARVFVLGHSLGAMMAPRIAQHDTAVAGLIVMAGPTRPLEDLLDEQTAYLARMAGDITPAVQARLDAERALTARIRALTDADSASVSPLMGAPASYWLDLERYHPADVAWTLRLPMLILQGERDYQVTMVDFDGWRRALAGRPRVTLKSYPGLNHLFVAGTAPSVPAEYAATAHVAGQVVGDIAQWITTRRSVSRP